MEESLKTIKCSPVAFEIAQGSPELLCQQLFKREPEEDPLSSLTEYEKQELEESDPANKVIWFDGAVKLLLTLVKELRGKIGKSAKLKTIKSMWEIIEFRMREQGYNFTDKQIENKFRGLKRQYTKILHEDSKTGRKRRITGYEKEMTEILNDKTFEVPFNILGSKSSNEKNTEEFVNFSEPSTSKSMFAEETIYDEPPNVDAVGDSDDSVAEEDTQRTMKLSSHEQIIRELRLMRKEKEHFHKQFLKVVEDSNKRKEEILKEKNNILRQLLSSQIL